MRARAGVITADLSVMPAIDFITWLGNRRRTGILQLGDAGVVRQATIVAGRAVRMHSSRTTEGLGQFLLNAGLTRVDQLEQALRDARSSGARLGFVLATAHGLSASQVRRVVEYQIRELILDAVRWTTGRLVFAADEVDVARSEIAASVGLLDLRQLALARAREWLALGITFADLDADWQIDEWAVPRHLDHLRDEIVAMLGAGETLAGVVRRFPATAYEIHARLYELVQAGALSRVSRAQPTLIGSADILIERPEGNASALTTPETAAPAGPAWLDGSDNS
jgi:hypothetical protein